MSFISYINNVVIKLPIYFNFHMLIVQQIINIISKWFRVFMHDNGAYKHENAFFVSLIFTYNFFRKKIRKLF
jgi:hypothetical protein